MVLVITQDQYMPGLRCRLDHLRHEKRMYLLSPATGLRERLLSSSSPRQVETLVGSCSSISTTSSSIVPTRLFVREGRGALE
jgi:hypothetical protein